MLTIRQIAEQLNISVRSAYRLLEDGLPFLDIRGGIRIRPEDLEAFLQGRKVCLSGKTKKESGTRVFSGTEDAYIERARRGRKPRTLKPSGSETFGRLHLVKP
jgi:excisionase family DNA binding protein